MARELAVRYGPYKEAKVDSDRVNRWLTLGANIGVLIGIALLVFELDQNRDMMRSQIRNEISRGVLDLLALTAVNPLLADALARANRGQELTPSEIIMVGSRNESVLRVWENIHYQYRQGLFPQSEFDGAIATWSRILREQPALISDWCNEHGDYSAEFTKHMDALLPKGSC